MTTNLPALDSTTHVQSVTYDCTFGQSVAGGGKVTFQVPQPVKFTFTFDTGSTHPDPCTDLHIVTTDASWFDQSTEEAAIATALNGICSLIATLIGSDQASIQATVRIQRTWRISPDQTGTAAPVQIPNAPLVYAEHMAYP